MGIHGSFDGSFDGLAMKVAQWEQQQQQQHHHHQLFPPLPQLVQLVGPTNALMPLSAPDTDTTILSGLTHNNFHLPFT